MITFDERRITMITVQSLSKICFSQIKFVFGGFKENKEVGSVPKAQETSERQWSRLERMNKLSASKYYEKKEEMQLNLKIHSSLFICIGNYYLSGKIL